MTETEQFEGEQPDVEERRADVGWERRWGPWAGGLAVASVVATIAAVPVASTDVVQHVGDANDLTFLQTIGNSGGGQFAALLLRLFSILALIPFTLFMYRAIHGRKADHSVYIAVLGIVAFVVVSGTTAIGFFEVRDIARDFVMSDTPQTLARAENVLADARGGGLLRISNVVGLLGGLLFGVWISLTAVEATRVGLSTRFLGVFGIGAGITTAIGVAIAPSLFLAWVGSLGLLVFGYWPGGRPPAWDEGRAISWAEADRETPARRRGGEPV